MKWEIINKANDNEVIGSVVTNRSMTAEEICEACGVELAKTEEDFDGMPENGKYDFDDLEFVEVNEMPDIRIEELNKLSFEEAEKILLNAGYVKTDSAYSEDSNISDYVEDLYYTLFDKDGEEEHVVSYAEYKNKNNDPANDDGTEDFVINTEWEVLS